MTALFCDVVGSTAIAEEMDPEDFGELISRTISTMGAVVARYGGTVSDFGGDALAAIFGAPIAHEDDPYRAVRAGLEIVRAVDGLPVRVGINSGLVVAGDIDTGTNSTFSALGDTLNVAARLQTAADPDTVVISAETRRLLGSDIEATSLGSIELKGRSAPVEAFVVDVITGVDERRRGVRDLRSEMVGRQSELEAMTSMASKASEGSGQVVAVVGEPGVGKSRLISELSGGVQKPNSVWAVGQCVPYDEDGPYHLAASLVRSICGVGFAHADDVVEKAINDMCESSGAQHAATLARLAGVEGEYEELAPEMLFDTYVEAFADSLVCLSKTKESVVLVCEDVHWADRSSSELVGALIDRLSSLPVLMVLVMRPEQDTAGWGLLESARTKLGDSLTELQLRPLSSDDSRSLVANLLEIDSLPPTLRSLVTDKAEGNPFFLEEVVRMLIERDMVENVDGRWMAKEEVVDLKIPDTISGLLASRIDQLDPEVRKAGRVASVIGREIPVSLFGAVYDQETGEKTHPHLEGLEEAGMLEVSSTSPELTLTFKHALIQDSMYESLLRKERREIHSKVARSIKALYPDRLDDLAPALARHHETAGEDGDALQYQFSSAEKAMDQGARVEAATFFAAAKANLERSDRPNVSRVLDAGLGRLRAGISFTPANETLAWIDEMMPLAQELGDPERLAALYELAISIRAMRGENYSNPEFKSVLDEAGELIPLVDTERTKAVLAATTAWGMRSSDEYEKSLPLLEEAIDGFEAAGDFNSASFNSSMMADSLTVLGRFEEAIESSDRAAELARRGGDPNVALDADLIKGTVLAERGDLEESMKYTERGIEAASELGNTLCDLAGNFKLADAQLRVGEVDSAITHLQKSTGLAEYCNAGGYEALGEAWLASAKARNGDMRVEDFDSPLEKARALGSRSAEGLVLMQRGIGNAAVGNFASAYPDFERAIELFADYGGLTHLARAHHAYGEALEAAGDATGATDQLMKAQSLFDELGITPDPKSSNSVG